MKKTITIKRLSSGTLLKVMLITSVFPWFAIDTAIILYHLISGDFIVNFTSGSGPDIIAEEISLGKYVLYSYPLIVLAGALFTLLLWIPSAFSLWLWSKFRNMKISYYGSGSDEI